MRIKPLEQLLFKIGDEQLKNIITESLSMQEVFAKLGLAGSGHHYRILNRAVKRLKVSISHFSLSGLKRREAVSLDKILVENSTYTNTNKLRKRLIKEHIFEEQCNNCKLTQWMQRKIPLELEHKNGNKKDHRKENLELLCPNCHAQTEFYRGRNIGKQSN